MPHVNPSCPQNARACCSRGESRTADSFPGCGGRSLPWASRRLQRCGLRPPPRTRAWGEAPLAACYDSGAAGAGQMACGRGDAAGIRWSTSIPSLLSRLHLSPRRPKPGRRESSEGPPSSRVTRIPFNWPSRGNLSPYPTPGLPPWPTL